MLNTSLHNPSVKEKQTCDQFIKMCKETSKTELQDTMLKVKLNIHNLINFRVLKNLIIRCENRNALTV